MKLFYVIAKNKHNEESYTLKEELSSDYESSCIDIDLSFYNVDLTDPTTKIALFTSEEVELLKLMQNKEISYQNATQLRIKGEAVSRFDRLFDYVVNVEYIEVEFKI